MSLAFALGALFLLFRQIERWLHQHIFKVGWLLSDSFSITTILYYIVFLPGIVLHEAALWLAALAMRARAQGSIAFPAAQDIGELRLNFVRLADDTGRLKRYVIGFCPLAAGLAALWAIAAHIFRWDELLTQAGAGSLDGLAAALDSFLGTADVWLWFYLAFVIANTMFPQLKRESRRREKLLALVAAPPLAYGVWRLGLSVSPGLAAAIEGLMSGLLVIIAQICLVNLAMLLMLGAVEALVERLSKRSASFRDGRMITMTADQARANQAAQPDQPRPAKSRSMPRLRSIYDLRLPIPGPPGDEPVSRSAAAILDIDQPASAEPPEPPSPAADAERINYAAPFERPFAAREATRMPSDDWQADQDEASPPKPRVLMPRRARPAPKPDRREQPKPPPAPGSDYDDLVYEDLEDD